jgi:hypothetical protein
LILWFLFSFAKTFPQESIALAFSGYVAFSFHLLVSNLFGNSDYFLYHHFHPETLR